MTTSVMQSVHSLGCQRQGDSLGEKLILAAEEHAEVEQQGQFETCKVVACGLPACFSSSGDTPCELERPLMMKNTMSGVQYIAP